MGVSDLFHTQKAFLQFPADIPISFPEALASAFVFCQHCHSPLEKQTLQRQWGVCPHCGFHHPMDYRERIAMLFDGGVCAFWDADIQSHDVLNFSDHTPYIARIQSLQAQGHVHDAFVATTGMLAGHRVAMGFFDFAFLGGSMGCAVGEKLARMFERALSERTPVIIFYASGGARMQEGLFSLFQMAKVALALTQFQKQTQAPYISVLCYPTTGGVAASVAMMADVNLAEKDALIGFAGRRVIAQATRTPLPDDFQSAQYAYTKGMVDAVVARWELKTVLTKLLGLLCGTSNAPDNQ